MRVARGVKNAAERGKREVLVARFPSDHPTDRRAINHFESDWPEALTGFAKRAYKFWQKEPEPHGEKLRAQILDFPGGMPGRCWAILELATREGRTAMDEQ